MPRIYGARIYQQPVDPGTIGNDIDEGAPSSRSASGSENSSQGRSREPLGRSSQGRRRQPLGDFPDDYRAAYQRSAESFRGMGTRALEGWAEQGAGPGTMSTRGLRYFTGDEFKPAHRGRDYIEEMQRALVAAGYLDISQGFRFGSWDPPTVEAYRLLLEESNATGLTFDAQLAEAASSIMIGGDSRWTIDPETGDVVPIEEMFVAPPLELTLTNKDDLRAVLRDATIRLTGSAWDSNQINELADRYSWEQIRLQKEAYDANIAAELENLQGGEGGQIIESIDMQDPSLFFEEAIRTEHPDEWGAGQIAETYAPAFFDALGGYV